MFFVFVIQIQNIYVDNKYDMTTKMIVETESFLNLIDNQLIEGFITVKMIVETETTLKSQI